VPEFSPVLLVGCARWDHAGRSLLLGQNHLAHAQMCLLQVQEDHALIQRSIEGFTLFRLGARSAPLGKVVTPDVTPMGVASIMVCACLLERSNEGHETLLPRDDGALSAVKFPLLGKELVL
jgi:hypothetical protein